MLENNDQNEASQIQLRPCKELDYVKSKFGTVPDHLLTIFLTAIRAQDFARYYCRSVVKTGMYAEDLNEAKRMGEYFSADETNGVVRSLMNRYQLANLNYVSDFNQMGEYKPRGLIMQERLSGYSDRFVIEYGTQIEELSMPWLIFFRNLNGLDCNMPPEKSVDEQKIFADNLVEIYEQSRGYKPVILGGTNSETNFKVEEVDVRGQRKEVSWNGKLLISSVGVLEPFVDFSDYGNGKKINILTSFNRSWDEDTANEVINFRSKMGLG